MFLAVNEHAAMNIFMCADGNVQEEFLWAIFGSGIAGSLVLLDNKLFFPKWLYSFVLLPTA